MAPARQPGTERRALLGGGLAGDPGSGVDATSIGTPA